jgi:hypothetical protein
VEEVGDWNRENRWYQPHEYRAIKLESQRTWEWFKQKLLLEESVFLDPPPSHISISNLLEQEGLCERGLDEDIDDELQYSIGRRMRRSVAIVLDEQQRQRRRQQQQQHQWLLRQPQQQPTTTGAAVSPVDVIARLYRQATRVAQWCYCDGTMMTWIEWINHHGENQLLQQ